MAARKKVAKKGAAEIPGRHPHLEGTGRLARTMRFDDVADVRAKEKALDAVVKAWCDWRAG